MIGDVQSPNEENLNLAWETWRRIRRNTGFELVEIVEDSIAVGGKVTRIWGATRGQATKTDRILVLKKPGSRRYRAKRPEGVVNAMIAS